MDPIRGRIYNRRMLDVDHRMRDVTLRRTPDGLTYLVRPRRKYNIGSLQALFIELLHRPPPQTIHKYAGLADKHSLNGIAKHTTFRVQSHPFHFSIEQYSLASNSNP
jgi:hypothetical protein